VEKSAMAIAIRNFLRQEMDVPFMEKAAQLMVENAVTNGVPSTARVLSAARVPSEQHVLSVASVRKRPKLANR
jgi:hypothetical protein